MAKGMYSFQKKKIETFADQDRYSYYVAGVIGNLFNDLLHFNAIISLRLKRQLSRYARDFGLALQKVNILRDIADDISQNRYYWPRRLLAKYGLDYSSICSKENREKALSVLREQIEDARSYLNAAMKYILLLPKKALRVRMFCLIPLFMAIESYVKCMDNHEIFEAGKKVKITREQVFDIVAKSRLYGTSNERLASWFISSMRGAGAVAISEFSISKKQ
jgi:farnesyl-diphosphate farnesyltransferase